MPGRAARHLVLAADIPSTAAICPHAPGATGTLAQIRQVAGRLFDLRKTAAIDLLNRMGATICGQALVIGRGQLMARLREAQEHPGWRWEVVRTEAVHARIDALRSSPSRRSLVPVPPELAQQINALATSGLPHSIFLAPGRVVTIECHSMDWQAQGAIF